MPTTDSYLLLNSRVTRVSGEEIDFLIHYWGTTVSRFEHPVHRHSFFEVCYVAEGRGAYWEDGRSFPLRPGTVFLSRPDNFHQIQYGRDMVMHYVGFETDSDRNKSKLPALIQYRKLKEAEHFVADGEQSASTIRIWKALWAQAANPSICFESVLRQLSYALLCSFHQLFIDCEPGAGSVPAPAVGQDARSLIYQAKLFIQDNLAQRITAQDVANYLYISKRHLARLFAREGISYTGYLREKQIERAVHLLQNKQIPIKDIAEQTGFTSLHYFTKAFSREVGMPPGRYRSTRM